MPPLLPLASFVKHRRGLKHVMKIVPPNSARSLTARLVFSYLKITPARSDPLSLRPCNNGRAIHDLRYFVPPMAIRTHVGLIVRHVGRISFRNISPRGHVSAPRVAEKEKKNRVKRACNTLSIIRGFISKEAMVNVGSVGSDSGNSNCWANPSRSNYDIIKGWIVAERFQRDLVVVI